jgi:hypothetical protein
MILGRAGKSGSQIWIESTVSGSGLKVSKEITLNAQRITCVDPVRLDNRHSVPIDCKDEVRVA